METPLHRIFISYHHKDQRYKDDFVKQMDMIAFDDRSVDTGDIDENLPDQSIRKIIRDNYLKDTSVTIVLVGEETRTRKHVDWEIYSSMYDGAVNKKSGILIINLPTLLYPRLISVCDEDKAILGKNVSWSKIQSYEPYSYLPQRLLDNIQSASVKICMANYYDMILNPFGLKTLVDIAFKNRTTNAYDLSQPMRRRNGS